VSDLEKLQASLLLRLQKHQEKIDRRFAPTMQRLERQQAEINRIAAPVFARWSKIERALPAIPERVLQQADEVFDRCKAALRRPADDPIRKAWRHVEGLSLSELYDHYRYLPDPRRRDRGRPSGSGRLAKHLPELERRIKAGEKPTSAANEILRSAGVVAGLKGRADALVRLWKKSVSK
jgi:hypothetical protein